MVLVDIYWNWSAPRRWKTVLVGTFGLAELPKTLQTGSTVYRSWEGRPEAEQVSEKDPETDNFLRNFPRNSKITVSWSGLEWKFMGTKAHIIVFFAIFDIKLKFAELPSLEFSKYLKCRKISNVASVSSYSVLINSRNIQNDKYQSPVQILSTYDQWPPHHDLNWWIHSVAFM